MRKESKWMKESNSKGTSFFSVPLETKREGWKFDIRKNIALKIDRRIWLLSRIPQMGSLEGCGVDRIPFNLLTPNASKISKHYIKLLEIVVLTIPLLS